MLLLKELLTAYSHGAEIGKKPFRKIKLQQNTPQLNSQTFYFSLMNVRTLFWKGWKNWMMLCQRMKKFSNFLNQFSILTYSEITTPAPSRLENINSLLHSSILFSLHFNQNLIQYGTQDEVKYPEGRKTHLQKGLIRLS